MPPELKKKLSKQRQHNVSLGQGGETRAVEFLRAQGWEIVATNVVQGHDEIDVVAIDPQYDEIVFVEVKTRGTDFAGDPSEAIDERKLEAMVRAGQDYMQKRGFDKDWRFDVVAVLPGRVEHFENITWL